MFPKNELTCEQMNNGALEAHWNPASFPGAKLALRLARFWLVQLGAFVGADLHGGGRAEFEAGRRRRANGERPSLTRRLGAFCAQPTAGAKLVRLFFLYCTCKLLVQTLWALIYNAHRTSVERLTSAGLELQAGRGQQAPPLARRQLEAERASLARAYRVLDSMGAPFLEFNFANVISNICGLAIVYFTFMHTQLFFDFDFGVARALLSGRLEQRHQINGAICDQVNRFLASNENFLKNRLESLRLKISELAPESGQAASSPTSWRNAASCTLARAPYELELGRLIERQSLVGAQLRQLALAGCLQPPNRNGAWLSKLALVYLSLISALLPAFLAAINGALMVTAGGLLPDKRLRVGPRDLAVLAEYYLYAHIAVLASIFYLPVVTVSCLDQIHHALSLARTIDAAVRANDLWLAQRRLMHERQRQLQLAAAAAADHHHAFSAIVLNIEEEEAMDVGVEPRGLNLRLVAVLIQFRLFVQQMEAVKASTSLSLSICTILMSSTPIMSRLFAHHLEKEIKLLALAYSVVFIYNCDFFIVPNCYLHSRCLGLYKRLWRLLARSIEVTHVEAAGCANCAAAPQIYEQHSIWLLRTELSMCEKSLSKFVPTALGQQLHYASRLRVHFWCGLLLISMFYAPDASKQPPGGLLGGSLWLF